MKTKKNAFWERDCYRKSETERVKYIYFWKQNRRPPRRLNNENKSFGHLANGKSSHVVSRDICHVTLELKMFFLQICFFTKSFFSCLIFPITLKSAVGVIENDEWVLKNIFEWIHGLYFDFFGMKRPLSMVFIVTPLIGDNIKTSSLLKLNKNKY